MNSRTTAAVSASETIISLPVFADMENEILRGMIASARIACYEKGAAFLAQGQPVTRFYVMLEGWCGVSKGNSEGQESILQIFRRGDFLPEPGLVSIETCLFNVQALTPVKLLMLPPTIVRNALDRSPVFMRNILLAFARRGQELRDHIEQLTLHNAEQRVGRFILQMRAGAAAGDRDVPLPFDKSFIASYLGIKPETLSRTLQIFRDKGFIVGRNCIVVPNFESLCNFCDSGITDGCLQSHTEECPLFVPSVPDRSGLESEFR